MNKSLSSEVVLCDLDGVVWLAHHPIEGSVEAIAALRAQGVRVLFVTNNSFSTVQQQEQALEAIGIPAKGDVLTSAMSAATAIAPGWRVLVCGGEGLIEETQKAGATAVVPYKDGDLSGSFDAVVVGLHREFNFNVLSVALSAVNNGAQLIGSNDDPTYPTPRGPLPGGGAILAAIAKASGVLPLVTGKPHQPMARLVQQMCPGVSAGNMVMVGDREDTDGAFAKTLGCAFGLVLSGVTASGEGSHAEYVEPSLAHLAERLLNS